jgi:ribonuclease BN (tRNA processing enzyme)
MKLTVVGCGDAFGSGGRLQTCFHVVAPEETFLIDCGATSLIGMQKLGLDPDRVGTIFISHLHGDHFGGLVWWLLHAHYVTQRTAPLTITGPVGIEARFAAAAEALFPGSTKIVRRFDMRFLEYADGVPLTVGGVRVTPREVRHPSGAPPYALRIECAGRIIGFSGDTEWTESLVPTAEGADLYITECFGFELPSGYHLTWRMIEKNLPRLDARRIMLSHLGPAMLGQEQSVNDPRVVIAKDGLTLEV